MATIAGWCLILDWLAYRWSAFERLIHPPPLLLVKHGQLLRRNRHAS